MESDAWSVISQPSYLPTTLFFFTKFPNVLGHVRVLERNSIGCENPKSLSIDSVNDNLFAPGVFEIFYFCARVGVNTHTPSTTTPMSGIFLKCLSILIGAGSLGVG